MNNDNSESDEEDFATSPQGTADLVQEQSEKTAHYFVFSGDNKAGMHGYEKKKQAQVIYDMSKESSFFKQAKKQDMKRQVRINEAKKKVERYLASKNNSLSNILKKDAVYREMPQVSMLVNEHESRRDLNSIKVVLDMDMFFAAVAVRDRPQLKDKPVAIGGMSMISTSNYVARTFGVRSAMPGFIAKKLCPQLIFIEHEPKKYKEASDIVKNVLLEYDKNLVSYSSDEFYLDITHFTDEKLNGKKQVENERTNCIGEMLTESVSNHQVSDLNCVKKKQDSSASSGHTMEAGKGEHAVGIAIKRNEKDASERAYHFKCGDTISDEFLFLRRKVACDIVDEMRQRVFVATRGLTCSAAMNVVGIANNSFLAKICADQNKPNGQYSLPPTRDAILKFLEDLPCRKIPGIGRVTDNILSELNFKTVGDIRRHRDRIFVAFTPKQSKFLIRASLGVDSTEGASEEGDSSPLKSSKNKKNEILHSVSELQKSIGTERTFSPTTDINILLKKLDHVCCRVHEDLKGHGICGGNVTLKIKTSEFQLFTRSCGVTKYVPGIFHLDDIFSVSKNLFLAFITTYTEDCDVNTEESELETDGIKCVAPSRSSRFPTTVENINTISTSSPSLSPVSIRLIGVQISKLCHYNETVGSLRESKLCKMLLSSPGVSTTPFVSEKDSVLRSSVVVKNKKVAVCRNTNLQVSNGGDLNSGYKRKRASTSVLDLMHRQAEGSVSASSSCAVDENGSIHPAQNYSGSRDGRIKSHQSNKNAAILEPGKIKNQTMTKNISGTVLVCPICSYKCETLIKLNYHLDRCCDSSVVSKNREIKKPRNSNNNNNNITKYFGNNPS